MFIANEQPKLKLEKQFPTEYFEDITCKEAEALLKEEQDKYSKDIRIEQIRQINCVIRRACRNRESHICFEASSNVNNLIFTDTIQHFRDKGFRVENSDNGYRVDIYWGD